MDLDTNINLTGSGSISPISGESSSGSSVSHKKVDTLSVADQEALATMMLAGFPMLPPPNPVEYSDDASLEALALKSEADMQKISEDMLKSWSASIAKENQLVQDYLHSDDYQRWLDDHKETSAVTSKAPTEIIATNQFVQWSHKQEVLREIDPLMSNLGNYLQQVNANKAAAIESLPFGMVAFTAPAALSETSSPYFRDILIAANLPIQQGAKADLSLVGAIFSAGALNYAEAANTTKALLSDKNKHSDVNLALNYGNRVVSLLTDPHFDKFLSAMFSNKGTEAQINERSSVFKLVLAATALMAIYVSEAKWMSRESFTALVNAKTDPRSTTEASLVAIFQIVKNSGIITRGVYDQMVAGLGDYASRNPNFSSFFKVENAFSAIADRVNAAKKASATLPGSTPI